ncbi:uncharacterized protein J3D65DRAFT_136569 [Phyllosticta citribraziliensis]|uniref:Uncharacterized protein n=1 Tax=Phyllosticta citribraziliensis TaxID=989973 RepID=A0ABR1L7V0_9PEZI
MDVQQYVSTKTVSKPSASVSLVNLWGAHKFAIKHWQGFLPPRLSDSTSPKGPKRTTPPPRLGQESYSRACACTREREKRISRRHRFRAAPADVATERLVKRNHECTSVGALRCVHGLTRTWKIYGDRVWYLDIISDDHERYAQLGSGSPPHPPSSLNLAGRILRAATEPPLVHVIQSSPCLRNSKGVKRFLHCCPPFGSTVVKRNICKQWIK